MSKLEYLNEDEVLEFVFAEIEKNLDENSVVVLETEYMAGNYEGFEIIKQAKYGRVYITLYRLAER